MTTDRSQAKPHGVLLLGNYRPTIALARVLEPQGFQIFCGLDGWEGGAEFSRHVHTVWDHPPLSADEGRFTTALLRFLKEHPGIRTVFPVAEDYTRFFANNRIALPSSCAVAMVNPRLVSHCLNKRYMLNLAKERGVPVAAFAFANGPKILRERATRLGFPMVVRPQNTAQRVLGEKAVSCYSPEHLEPLIDGWEGHSSGLILQHKVAGRRHNIYFAAVDGEIRRYLHAVILRTTNADGSGLAVDGITIEPHPELKRHTKTLSAALNYTGVGCAQFLVDDDTGKICFLEINARIAGNHAVPEVAGLDLSRFLIDLQHGGLPDFPYKEGRVGLRYAWTSGELGAIRGALRGGDIGVAGALRQLFTALTTGVAADIHMTWSRHDPLPGLMAMIDLVPRVKKLRKRLGKATRARRTDTLPQQGSAVYKRSP